MSFTPKEHMSDKLKKKIGLSGYVKREREVNEALSRSFNLMKQPVYKPVSFQPPRSKEMNV